ncbi:MAG: hypothetical protein AB7U62_15555 [Pseudolabrys sp.]
MSKRKLPKKKLTPAHVQELIDTYRRLIFDPRWFRNVCELVDQLRLAEKALKSIKRRIDICKDGLDRTSVMSIQDGLIASSNGDFDVLSNIVDGHAESYGRFADVISACLDLKGYKKKHQTVPISIYDQATIDLIVIYERVIGVNVVNPSLTSKSPLQASTTFLVDCLRQIDPRLTPKNAVSCIRSALKVEKQCRADEISAVGQFGNDYVVSDFRRFRPDLNDIVLKAIGRLYGVPQPP